MTDETNNNDFVVYFRSLGNNPYTSALRYADGSSVGGWHAYEIGRLEDGGWKRVEGWAPAEAGMEDQVLLRTDTPIGEWDAIVGIVPARYFRALVGHPIPEDAPRPHDPMGVTS